MPKEAKNQGKEECMPVSDDHAWHAYPLSTQNRRLAAGHEDTVIHRQTGIFRPSTERSHYLVKAGNGPSFDHAQYLIEIVQKKEKKCVE